MLGINENFPGLARKLSTRTIDSREPLSNSSFGSEDGKLSGLRIDKQRFVLAIESNSLDTRFAIPGKGSMRFRWGTLYSNRSDRERGK